MADKIIVECPSCKVRFFVTQDLLLVANGALRCGFCQHVFNGVKNIKSAEKQELSKKTASEEDNKDLPAQPEKTQVTETKSNYDDDIETKLANINNDAKDNDEYWQKIATNFSGIVGVRKDGSEASQTISEQNKTNQSSSSKVDDDILDYLDSIDFDAILQPKEHGLSNDAIQPEKNSVLNHEHRRSTDISEMVNNSVDSHKFSNENTDIILDSLLNDSTKNWTGIIENDLASESAQDKLANTATIKPNNELTSDDDITAALDSLLEQPIKPSLRVTNASEEITKIHSNANNTSKIKSPSVYDKQGQPESNVKNKSFLHSEVDAKAALNKLRNANIKSKKEFTDVATDQSINITADTDKGIQQNIESGLIYQDLSILADKNQQPSSIKSPENLTINKGDSVIKPMISDVAKSTTPKVLIGSDKPIEFKPSGKIIPSISKVDTITADASLASSDAAVSKEENSRKGNVLSGTEGIKESINDSSKLKIELVPIEIISTTDEEHPPLHTQLSATRYAERVAQNENASISADNTDNTESLTHKLASILKKKMKH